MTHNNTFKLSIIALALGISSISVFAQDDYITDSILSRNIVVEREFQPIIQQAGKLPVAPHQIETKIDPVPVTYSDYSMPVRHVFNLHTLTASGLKFNNIGDNKGWLEVGGGFPLTHLDFGYNLRDKDDILINLFAKHNGQWGQKTWAESTVGMDFTKRYSNMSVYFDVDGNHTFFTRYGRYYDGDNKLSAKYKDFRKEDKQNIWEVNANVGVKADRSESIQYRVQTGYTGYILPSKTAEHIIRTHADVAWQDEEQKAGAMLYVQNAFYTIDKSLKPANLNYNSRHAIRLQPFYEYNGSKWLVHVGANIDMNIGKGKLLSGNKNISFAPSPDVNVEYRVIPNLLALYIDAKGGLGTGTMQEYINSNPYRNPIDGLISSHVANYTPVDAGLGIRLRPTNTLYLEVYARYARLNNLFTVCAPTTEELLLNKDTFLDYFYSNHNRWTVGVELLYHYQDIVQLSFDAHYYHWSLIKMETPESFTYDELARYDNPAWDTHLRVDVFFNRQWSIYSDNTFAGSRKALLTDGTKRSLKPTIDLNLGVRYNINRWIYVYAQLNNFIHRHNDIYYGYQTQGINGQIGFHWDF